MNAADLAPGYVFEADTRFGPIRATLVELTDEAYRSEVEVGPTANGGPLHRYLHQEERFVVHEGVLRVRTGLRGSSRVGPGEEVAVPPGRPHTYSVESEGARYTAEFTPSLGVADYFLELFQLEDPGLRDLARLVHRYPKEHFYLPVIPPALQRALLRPFV